jgi:hypothetical protein
VDLDVFQASLTPCKAALTPVISGPWRGNRRAPVQGLLRARSRRHMGSSLASTFKQRHSNSIPFTHATLALTNISARLRLRDTIQTFTYTPRTLSPTDDITTTCYDSVGTCITSLRVIATLLLCLTYRAVYSLKASGAPGKLIN